jgi:transcriptional regulator with XRE-family HTH domain
LDAAKKRLGIESDYALSKRLGLTTSAISNYRAGRSHMDDVTAVKIAELLGMHPGLVMLDMHRERAKTPQERKIWQDIFQGFRTLLRPANRMGAC